MLGAAEVPVLPELVPASRPSEGLSSLPSRQSAGGIERAGPGKWDTPGGSRVYVLGAGVNRCVKEWDETSPPLATDYFAVVRARDRAGRGDSPEGKRPFHPRYEALYRYIHLY